MAGEGGHIIHTVDNGNTRTPETTNATDLYFSMWSSSPEDIYVASAGGITHSAGDGVWTSIYESSKWLYGIWGAGPHNIVAVGQSGSILFGQ